MMSMYGAVRAVRRRPHLNPLRLFVPISVISGRYPDGSGRYRVISGRMGYPAHAISRAPSQSTMDCPAIWPRHGYGDIPLASSAPRPTRTWAEHPTLPGKHGKPDSPGIAIRKAALSLPGRERISEISRRGYPIEYPRYPGSSRPGGPTAPRNGGSPGSGQAGPLLSGRFLDLPSPLSRQIRSRAIQIFISSALFPTGVGVSGLPWPCRNAARPGRAMNRCEYGGTLSWSTV